MEDYGGMGLFIAALPYRGQCNGPPDITPTGECRLGDLSPQKLRRIVGSGQ